SRRFTESLGIAISRGFFCALIFQKALSSDTLACTFEGDELEKQYFSLSLRVVFVSLKNRIEANILFN
ncbi:hypothetical protein, partial [uncultured Bacteroides sp.]|uniref:hypothetical protein n=1 Tax=uncultured Bacteroides sp. TaxID=162156 RepID=UPI00280AA560